MAKNKHKAASSAAGEKAKDGSPSNGSARVVALLLVAAALGVACGAIVVGRLPVRELLPGAREAGALAKGNGATLIALAGSDRATPELAAHAALADALVLVDFGGGAEQVARLQALRKADPAVRNAPEALYARALFARIGPDDATLDDDLARAAGNLDDDAGDDQGEKGERGGSEPGEDDKDAADERKTGGQGEKERGNADAIGVATAHPALYLARAQRLLQANKLDAAWRATQRAALRPDAPVYALVAAARLALARGQARDAAALVERGLERAPAHGMLLTLLVLASAFDQPQGDAPSREAASDRPKQKPKKERGKKDAEPSDAAPPEPPDPPKPRPVTAAETRVANQLDELSARDAAVAAWALQALARARGDRAQAEAHAKRVMAEVEGSATLAARQAELLLLSGDVAAADELVTAALLRAPGDTDLLVAGARARLLRLDRKDAPPPGARAGAAGEAALPLPLGRLLLDATAAGLPMRAALDPSIIPDERLLDERAAGTADLEKRLAVVENVWRAERALARGDVAAASEAATKARTAAPQNPDALLVDASARLLQGDRDGVRTALQAAVASRADDPRVLLAAARISWDAEDLTATRGHLNELARLGYQSPAALAITAVVSAREGDAKAAQAALKEAESITASDVDVLRARLLLARLNGNLVEVRRQADRMLAVDDARSPDPLLRAWQGEALFRKGDTARAQTVLASVLAARPSLIDAHLGMGIVLAASRPLDAAAAFAQAIQIGGDVAVVAEATKRRAGIAGAPPLLPK